MKKKLSAILAAVCATSILLAGCGSKSEPAASTPAPTPSAPASSTPAAEPAVEPKVFRIGAVSNPTDTPHPAHRSPPSA